MWPLLGALIGCPSPPVPEVEEEPVVVEIPEAAPVEELGPRIPLPPVAERVDRVTEAYRDGFGPGTTIEDFKALSVRRRGPRGPVRVVKYYVNEWQGEQPELYFIDTTRQETHWWFARELMGEAWDVDRFARRTYYRVPRPDAALNLVLHEDLVVHARSLGHEVREPITVEMGEDDHIPPDMARDLVAQLQARFAPAREDEHRLLWLPPDEEAQVALAPLESSFEEAGAGWLDRQELYQDLRLQILNPGRAVGTLRHLSAEELDSAVISRQDVVVLERAPNDLPVVAGTITETFQTPLSHVAVASRARGSPNMALLDASSDPRIAPLLGQRVVLEVGSSDFTLRAATSEDARSIGTGGTLDLPAPDLSEQSLRPLDELGFADVRRVGAKAANVAELHRLVPEHAPDGFAVPFSWYHQHMSEHAVQAELCREAREDCEQEGRDGALCQEVLGRCEQAALSELSLRDWALALLEDPEISADAPLREAALDGVRFQVGHQPLDPLHAFALAQATREAFGEEAVRLRSSTNAEDLPGFSGAGLYRSVSAQAEGKRAVAERIRKVWASVWSWRAVEERAAWGIPHDRVQMGVLVHAAYRHERANGVVVTADLHSDRVDAITVDLSPGDHPVTNPEDEHTPEELVIWPDPELQVHRIQHASRTPGRPVLSEAELSELYDLCMRIRQHLAPLYGVEPTELVLDMELKLTEEGRLVIKQARPFPKLR